MYVSHLSLRNFRNYRELELPLQSGTTLFYGPNAAGKTTLLEALYYLATTKSPRTSADRELINWDTSADLGIAPFTRLVTSVQRCTNGKDEKLLVELVVQRKQDAAGNSLPTTSKTIRINKTPRRALDLVGQLRVVLFTPLDIDLLTGPPAERRRWLDIMLSQLDGRYVRALSEYQKAVLQRNALLRSWREGRRRPRPDEAKRQLQFWDSQLASNGAYVIAQRKTAIRELADVGAPIHQEIAGVPQPLQMSYVATVEGPDDRPGLQQAFTAAIERTLRDELERGQTLIGPHRDDVVCRLADVDIGVYGSRGQQRSLTLALKLAEAELMRARTGDAPVLLLDDILSELDAARRAHLLQFIDRPDQQTLMSAADLADFDPSFLTHIQRVRVEHGRIL